MAAIRDQQEQGKGTRAIRPGERSEHQTTGMASPVEFGLGLRSQHHEGVRHLLPLPYTEEALIHVADDIRRMQDFFGRELVLKNASSYFT